MKATSLLTLALIALSVSLLSCAKGSSNSNTRAATATGYGTSCGTNMLNSQYGCLPQCGAGMVMYQNRCVAVTSNGNSANNYPGQSGYGGNQYNQNFGGGGGGGGNICSAQCGQGATMVQGTCLPQNTCYACYGYYQGYCYQGDAAAQYYGMGGTQ